MTNYLITNDGELMHYGVLGMKWEKRKALHDKLKKEAESEYDKSDFKRLETKWRKKNPKSDIDDFGDYLSDIHYTPDRDKHRKKAERLQSEVYTLSKGYIANQALVSALVSSVYLAPIASIVTKNTTGSGKKAAVAALATIGTMGVTSAISAKVDQNKTMKKYKDKY